MLEEMIWSGFSIGPRSGSPWTLRGDTAMSIPMPLNPPLTTPLLASGASLHVFISDLVTFRDGERVAVLVFPTSAAAWRNTPRRGPTTKPQRRYSSSGRPSTPGCMGRTEQWLGCPAEKILGGKCENVSVI
jgi:hypothetical protein